MKLKKQKRGRDWLQLKTPFGWFELVKALLKLLKLNSKVISKIC